MKTSLVIISNSDSVKCQLLTLETIETALIDKEFISEIIVINTGEKSIKYPNCKEYYFHELEFNYHNTLNFAVKTHEFKSNYITFCNNDLIFTEGWASQLLQAMELNNLQCASPANIARPTVPQIIYGYEISKTFTGWCFTVRKDIFETIGLFDNEVTFWYSDNLFCEQLKFHDIRNALITDSIVKHKTSQSHFLLSGNEATSGQRNKFEKAKLKYENKYTFSIIMPVTLEMYGNCAKEREKIFIQAVKSVLNQNFKDYELIIISDGDANVIEIYNKLFSEYHPKIKCLAIHKQPVFSGFVRQIGINHAKGKYITYLDSDDLIGRNHLQIIFEQLSDNDFVYYNSIEKGNERNTRKDWIRTACMTHLRNINVFWDSFGKPGEDIRFSENCIKKSVKNEKIRTPEYHILHV